MKYKRSFTRRVINVHAALIFFKISSYLVSRVSPLSSPGRGKKIKTLGSTS